MHITIVTIFPEFFDSALSCGLLGQARERGLVSFSFVNPRDFAFDRHRSVDDRPYGGGPGMVMTLPPLKRAMQSIETPGQIVAMTPRGKPFCQSMAESLSHQRALTLVCGRYEGYDERFTSLFPVEETSVGDMVLNGGETAALAVIEATTRLIPGFMGHADSGSEESFAAGLLEYPHYTRPEEFEELVVPEVLLSGDHAAIAAWRRKKSLETTLARRPDLFDQVDMDRADMQYLASIMRQRMGRNLYLCLVHGPVRNKYGQDAVVSLTNLDLHDIARVSRTYGLGGFSVVTPLEDQKKLAATLLSHWTSGPGGQRNPDRAEALSLVSVHDRIEDAMHAVKAKTGQAPIVFATSATAEKTVSLRCVQHTLTTSPILLLFGTGHGLTEDTLEFTTGCLRPIRPFDVYNHLSVRAAAAITVDRLLGDVG
ncbi:tRNA (guanosine(37)-N1)-methyltransferase TrmD [Desulfovibrio inopinatus]|uniref:tRNA (guanosine(37)-N1)-methyltransferase TrmD n=1 Tax=Desulfovibrio inopinatus TaxID=102109 RepID=UPI0004214E17|nr:tRNA (guanosine(37)-N1)-methyltransferase TrmD [Desulfovibrio inopinatus]